MGNSTQKPVRIRQSDQHGTKSNVVQSSSSNQSGSLNNEADTKLSIKKQKHQQIVECITLDETYLGIVYMLPMELIQLILSLLDEQDLGRLACVNWAWNYISESDYLWKSYLDQAGISAPVNSNLNYKEYYLEEKKFKTFSKVFKHPAVIFSDNYKSMSMKGFPGWCMAVVGDSLRANSIRQVKVVHSRKESEGEFIIAAVTNLSWFLAQGKHPGVGMWGLTKGLHPPSVAYYTSAKEVIGFSVDLKKLKFEAWKEGSDGTKKDAEVICGGMDESVRSMQWWIVVCICSSEDSVTLCDQQ